MIYIADISAPVSIRVPRTTAAPDGLAEMVLRLVNTTSRKAVSTAAPDWSVVGGYYLLPDLDLSALADEPGEWEYALLERGVSCPLACGILRVGAAPASQPIQYEKPAEYEQYNA